jgi:hypothetical protein
MKNTKTLIRQSVNWTQRNALFLAIMLLPSLSRAAGGDISTFTDGFKTALKIVFMFGFVWGVIKIWQGASAIAKGDPDGKAGIIAGLIIAGAGAVMTAFFSLFGNDSAALTVE